MHTQSRSSASSSSLSSSSSNQVETRYTKGNEKEKHAMNGVNRCTNE
jgi:hypothetical protein